MMHPYRYRCDKKPPEARAFFAKCGRLGKICEIWGQSASSDYSRHEWEVHIRGATGQARFTGLSWGDEGDGAKALRDLLLFLGLSSKVAEKVAFHAPRQDWVCWNICLPHAPDKPIEVFFRTPGYWHKRYVFGRKHLAAVPPVCLVAH
jgi:hypothetical protein